tara:strand:+ start:557 stop:793 length:237 start_codon:yes stop_codon:yes gene_type:complete
MLPRKKIKQLVEDNKEFLEALEEFDRTGQLSRASYKERISLTIDMDIMGRFRNYCEKHNLKMSNVVESLLKEKLGIKQ